MKYTDGKDIIEVTNKSPKGFAGVVFIAYRNGVECLVTPADIKQWKPLEDEEVELVAPELPELLTPFDKQLIVVLVVASVVIYFLLTLTC